MPETGDVEGQPVTEAPFSLLNTRAHQMFPRLTPEEIDRVRRFGAQRHWEAGQPLFETGRPGQGMYVLLSGAVRITRRDGLGREHVIIEHSEPGFFMAEVATLTGRP